EGLGEARDEFGPGLSQRTQRQVSGDLPTYRLQGGHARGAEIALDKSGVGGVLRRIHSVGYRQVTGGAVAEAVVVREDAADIGVADAAPVVGGAPGDRTVFAHPVVGVALIGKYGGGSGVPIRRGQSRHGRVPAG